VVSKGIEKEVGKITDRALKEYGEVTKASQNHIKKLEELMTKSKERFNSYYKRKTIIDYLIYANLVITPILFLIVVYVVFVKR
jgi:hypothetical protein